MMQRDRSPGADPTTAAGAPAGPGGPAPSRAYRLRRRPRRRPARTALGQVLVEARWVSAWTGALAAGWALGAAGWVCSATGCAPPVMDPTVQTLKRASLPPVPGGAHHRASPPLSYLFAGDETLPRVIYIHGTPGSADGWADYLLAPVPGLEAVAVDRLGFGESGGRQGCVDSFARQAAAIAPLLVKRQGRWPTLVGHSLGGPIAVRLAAMHPERVGGLVIVAGSLDPAFEDPSVLQWIATTWLVRFFLPQVLDNSMGELEAAKRETLLLAPELGRVICPVIVIHGDKDQLVPYGNVAYAERTLVNARPLKVIRLEGQGHFVPWERPEIIRAAIEELADLEAKAEP